MKEGSGSQLTGDDNDFNKTFIFFYQFTFLSGPISLLFPKMFIGSYLQQLVAGTICLILQPTIRMKMKTHNQNSDH